MQPGGAEEHDGQVAPDGPGDPGESERVSERLELEHGHPDRRVVGPRLEQVVAADVGLRPEGHDGRHAHAAPVEPAGHSAGDRARLARHADGPGRARGGVDQRVEAMVPLFDAARTGSDEAHPGASRDRAQLQSGRGM